MKLRIPQPFPGHTDPLFGRGHHRRGTVEKKRRFDNELASSISLVKGRVS